MKALDILEKVNAFIVQNAKSLHPYQDAISLKSVEFNKYLQDMFQNIGDMKDRFPVTFEMLKRGLRLRGELVPQE